jgi:methylated-DNA-protein-cysteine methyltransferase-like protein
MSDELNFPEKVIAITCAIPRGKVLNYGRIAELLEKPRNSRAVGYALNGLPHGTDVPWQRVVGKNGVYGKISVRAFSHGADEQFARLQEEGIQFDANRQFRLMDYLWQPDPAEIAAILAAAINAG